MSTNINSVKKKKRLTCTSPRTSRKTLARLMREYYDGEIDPAKFRTLAYAFGILSQYWKMAELEDMDLRLKSIEKILSERKTNGE